MNDFILSVKYPTVYSVGTLRTDNVCTGNCGNELVFQSTGHNNAAVIYNSVEFFFGIG